MKWLIIRRTQRLAWNDCVSSVCDSTMGVSRDGLVLLYFSALRNQQPKSKGKSFISCYQSKLRNNSMYKI